MNSTQEQQLNQAAYRRLSDSIARTYPHGRFVAISGGLIIADAERFDELRAVLEDMGKDPAQVLIVQAGVEYPESGIIFAEGTSQ